MARNRKTRSESEALVNRVCHFHKKVAHCDSKITWQHFKIEGQSKATIYHYTKLYGDCDEVTFKKIPGRKPPVATP